MRTAIELPTDIFTSCRAVALNTRALSRRLSQHQRQSAGIKPALLSRQEPIVKCYVRQFGTKRCSHPSLARRVSCSTSPSPALLPAASIVTVRSSLGDPCDPPCFSCQSCIVPEIGALPPCNSWSRPASTLYTMERTHQSRLRQS